MVFICAAAFGVLLLAYRRSSAAKENPQIWIRRAAFGAAALGASWGFAAAAFFPGAQEEQVLIAFVVALVTEGGLPLFSTVWWVYAVYAGAIILPFNIVLLAHGTPFFHFFGALAEFERDLIRERTIAGLSAARSRGRTGGRRPLAPPRMS